MLFDNYCCFKLIFHYFYIVETRSSIDEISTFHQYVLLCTIFHMSISVVIPVLVWGELINIRGRVRVVSSRIVLQGSGFLSFKVGCIC